jgi:hypothetical protein
MPIMTRALALVAALALLPALPAALPAQVAHPLLTLRAGDTVRVWTSSPAEQIGVVATATTDTLGLRRFDGQPFAIPVPALSHLDVQRGRKRSPLVIVGGVIGGAAIGAVLGAWAGAGLECAGGCDGEFGGLAGFVIGGTVGIIGGGITGGVLGARYRVRRWERVYPGA